MTIVAGAFLCGSTLALAGCDEDSGRPEGSEGQPEGETVAADVPVDLVRFGACGSLIVYGVSAEEDEAILLRFDVPPGEDHQQTYALPHPEVDAVLVVGEQVDDPFCNDLTGRDHRVDQTLTIATGTIRLEVAGSEVRLTAEGMRSEGGSSIRFDPVTTDIGSLGG